MEHDRDDRKNKAIRSKHAASFALTSYSPQQIGLSDSCQAQALLRQRTGGTLMNSSVALPQERPLSSRRMIAMP